MLLQVPGIAQAVVDTYEPAPGTVELVGYYSLRRDTAPVDQERIYADLRRAAARLHGAGVPRAARRHPDDWPATRPTARTSRRRRAAVLVVRSEYVARRTDTETRPGRGAGRTLRVDRVSVDSHFFDDLGANSLLMAQFCAAVRKAARPAVGVDEGRLPAPDDRALAALSATGARRAARRQLAAAPGRPVGGQRAHGPGRRTRPPAAAGGHRAYVLCGALQLLLFLGRHISRRRRAGRVGYGWVAAAHRPGRRLPALGSPSARPASSSSPGCRSWQVAAGRPLEGRGRSRVWSLALPAVLGGQDADPVEPAGAVRRLAAVRALPARARARRSAGARSILSRTVPVGTDLLTIGAGTVIREDVVVHRLPGARPGGSRSARSPSGATSSSARRPCWTSTPRWATAPSSATPRRCTPASACRPGSAGTARRPSPPTSTTGSSSRPRCGTARRFGYGAIAAARPRCCSAAAWASPPRSRCRELPVAGRAARAAGHGSLDRAGRSTVTRWSSRAVLFFGGVLLGCWLAVTVPAAAEPAASRPDQVYPLYGVRYWRPAH